MRRDQERAPSWIIRAFALIYDVVYLVFGWMLSKFAGSAYQQAEARDKPEWIKRGAILSAGVLIMFTVAVFARYVPQSTPAQPIPFSHRIHVSIKKLNCFFCHSSATKSANAGIPPVEKCLLCHNVIASNFWPIAKIKEYARQGKSIPWVRVNRVPDFVHFSHQPHLARRVDCSYCHDNVSQMDRIKPVNKFDMNYCVTCHWRRNASSDCITCHY